LRGKCYAAPALDAGHAAEDLRAQNRRIVPGTGIAAGDQPMSFIRDHPMDDGFSALNVYYQIAGAHFGDIHPMDCENIPRPNRWQHAGTNHLRQELS
jgi:hypothetical protein